MPSSPAPSIGCLPPSVRGSSRLRVPNNRPSRSSGMLVLVKGSGEPILSADLQTQDLLWFDPFGKWSERCGLIQGAVGPVPVVERFELAQCVQKVALVPDQGAV